jgi:hypothetical protein
MKPLLILGIFLSLFLYQNVFANECYKVYQAAYTPEFSNAQNTWCRSELNLDGLNITYETEQREGVFTRGHHWYKVYHYVDGVRTNGPPVEIYSCPDVVINFDYTTDINDINDYTCPSPEPCADEQAYAESVCGGPVDNLGINDECDFRCSDCNDTIAQYYQSHQDECGSVANIQVFGTSARDFLGCEIIFCDGDGEVSCNDLYQSCDEYCFNQGYQVQDFICEPYDCTCDSSSDVYNNPIDSDSQQQSAESSLDQSETDQHQAPTPYDHQTELIDALNTIISQNNESASLTVSSANHLNNIAENMQNTTDNTGSLIDSLNSLLQNQEEIAGLIQDGNLRQEDTGTTFTIEEDPEPITVDIGEGDGSEYLPSDNTYNTDLAADGLEYTDSVEGGLGQVLTDFITNGLPVTNAISGTGASISSASSTLSFSFQGSTIVVDFADYANILQMIGLILYGVACIAAVLIVVR